MRSFIKYFLIVGSHVCLAFLIALGLSCVVPLGLTFHASIVIAVLGSLVFVVFSLFGLALIGEAVARLFSYKDIGTLICFVIGGLLGAIFILLVSASVPAVLTASIVGSFVFGFIGSTLVVLLGLWSGHMSRQVLPVKSQLAV